MNPWMYVAAGQALLIVVLVVIVVDLSERNRSLHDTVRMYRTFCDDWYRLAGKKEED